MEDKNLVNGPGIDTQQERDQLNYRPTIGYTKPQVNASLYTSPTNADVTLGSITRPKVIELWGRSIDITDKLNTIESDFDKRLKDTYAIVPGKILSMVTEAARKFGYQLNDGKLPFALYKKVLQSSDSHEKIIVQDIFENYQADVNGSLVAELYPDVVEMQEDWKNTLDFIKSGLFAQLVPTSQVPKTNTKTDGNLTVIHDQEKKLSDSYIQAKGISDQYADTMRRIYLVDPASQAYFDAQSKYMDQKRVVGDLERRLATKNEVMSLIESKADDAEPFIDSLGRFASTNVYKGNTFDLLYSLLSQYTSGQETENGLRKVQALLKLSIDGKIESTDGVKTNIRSISNNQTKLNVNKSLVKSIHLRNEVYGEVFDTVNGFVDPPSNGIFDMVAEHIVDSVSRADSIYTEQSSDFYKVSALDTELRRDKLFQLVDKDSARGFYMIIDSLVSYAKQKGWPNRSNLSSWLKDFINHEGL